MDSLYLMQLAFGSLGEAYPSSRPSDLRSLYVLLPGEEIGYVCILNPTVCYLLVDSMGSELHTYAIGPIISCKSFHVSICYGGKLLQAWT